MNLVEQSPIQVDATPVNVNPIARVEDASLAIDDTTPVERMAELLCALDAIKERVRAVEKFVKAKAIAWIEANKRSIPLGDGSYWFAAFDKKTKCLDAAATLEALLMSVGGDVGKLATFIASDGIKHGASRQALDAETFARLFETKETPKLDRDGKPAKSLEKGNPAFAR